MLFTLTHHTHTLHGLTSSQPKAAVFCKYYFSLWQFDCLPSIVTVICSNQVIIRWTWSRTKKIGRRASRRLWRITRYAMQVSAFSPSSPSRAFRSSLFILPFQNWSRKYGWCCWWIDWPNLMSSSEELPHFKLPHNIEDAKNLGLVLSNYTNRYFITVYIGYVLTYILWVYLDIYNLDSNCSIVSLAACNRLPFLVRSSWVSCLAFSFPSHWRYSPFPW